MTFSNKPRSAAGKRAAKATLFAILLLLATAVCRRDARAQAQDGQNTGPQPTSGLAKDNLSRVAASVSEIKAILISDPGLMVELKRWVASDATNHGQVISDPDLTDSAIFQRLEDDLPFRSIATALVQKYGYLVPKLNPESQAAKEQELLLQERTKWIAQSQEEERAQARARAAQEAQKAAACAQQQQTQSSDADCKSPQSTPSRQTPGGLRQIQAPGNVPNDQFQQNLPGESINPLERAQLLQTANESGGIPSQGSPFSLAGSMGTPASFNGFGGGMGLLSQGDETSGSRQISAAFGGLGSTGSGTDGLLAAYGMEAGTGTGFGSGIGGMTAALGSGIGNLDLGQMNNPLVGGSSPLTTTRPYSWNKPTAVAPPAEISRMPNPYSDIPSLYDMYVQANARPSSPERFGTEIFENGTRDPQLIPMDLPVGPDYVVGPGDGLSIDLVGGTSQRLTRTVDRQGRISLPEVGPVLVSGKSLADVQQDVQQVLRSQYRDVLAGVSLARLRTIRVYEVGDVENAGAYDISSLSTPLNALFIAGGPTPQGSMRILKHYRGDQLVQTVDVYDLLLHGVKGDIKQLENGDTVQVPSIGPQVTIEGMVRRPAIYELRDEKTLASVLELAGGLLPAAALRQIEVQRLVAHDKQTMLSVDIPDNADMAEVTKKLEAFEIHDGDRIRVFPIASYNEDAIYIEGHVARPGRYSYHANMRVTDVLSSYKDILPEPATQYAEIIHLNAPDFRPSVESFDLAAALANPGQSPMLHPMDTLRIFSRFDFEETPTVSVLGDVRTPGTYRTDGQIHLADAVYLAGGLDPDAQTTDAQVFRYLPDGKFKIFSVRLGEALAENPTENIILQTRDRLLIHRNPDAVEQATVYVQGDVTMPGRYPLTTNMRVADAIRTGGGLKPSADAELADLTTYDWSNGTKLEGQHHEILIADALAGESKANLPLHNGDVITIRQRPDWNDLGATISVKGEVVHPGTYGIRPGERLSSVLEEAGGIQHDGYAYGAVLERTQVRELESKQQEQMIQRVKDAENNVQMMPETTAAQKQAKELALQQWQSSVEELSTNPPLGRVSIRISDRIDRWKGTSADIEVRAGDTLIIPKRPSYVLVSGQVVNATAITYRPGMSAKWYLSQAGGSTQLGDKKNIVVIRADGSVMGAKNGMFSGESLNAALQPGDTVLVPEKALGGSIQWESVFMTAQLVSAIATTVFYAVHY